MGSNKEKSNIAIAILKKFWPRLFGTYGDNVHVQSTKLTLDKNTQQNQTNYKK